MLLVVQVSVGAGAMLTLGGFVLVCTVVVAKAVQPLLGSVTVSVYVPGVVTVIVGVVALVLHKYVTPVVVLLPVSVTLVFVQVSLGCGAMLTLGTAPLLVTVTTAESSQPLVG
jgi:hypothetical protein